MEQASQVLKAEAPQTKPLISLIVPVYNEEGNIRPLYDRVCAVLNSEAAKYDFEFVFTDNRSEDMTFPLLQELARQDPRVRAYRFSRNFGFQRSILSGYRLARGVAAIQIDCDLQDPPELIPEFLRKWEEGFAVVYGVRARRPEPMLLETARKVFYRLLDYLSDDRLPHDAGDFRIIDRRVIDIVAATNDASPYLRGFIAGVGFKQTGITYDRSRRTAGKSKFGLKNLARLATDAIANHSIVPLRVASAVGLAATALSLVLTIMYLINYYFFGDTWPRGFATLLITILFASGLNAMFLGLIGEYIGRIYQQVKPRANAIVDEGVERGTSLPAERISGINGTING